MTYSLEIQIEELRAELAACSDWDERLTIEAELAGARQELAYAEKEQAAAIAELNGVTEAEPPF